MLFKISFPTGYQQTDIFQDNIDVNIILANGDIYFGTCFTVLDIQSIMSKGEEPYFWATDMVIVKDLRKETIREVVDYIIAEEYIDIIFSKIGTIGDHHIIWSSFEEIEDMNDLP